MYLACMWQSPMSSYMVYIHLRIRVYREMYMSYTHFTCIVCADAPHDLFPLCICLGSLPHGLHLNLVSGTRLEGGQSVGGVTVGRLGAIDGAILVGVGHSEGVALGVAG